MITSGWPLLAVLFFLMLFVVQRAERSRRVLVLFFALAGCAMVAGFGLFRISTDCNLPIRFACEWPGLPEARLASARATVALAFFVALVFNGLFWLLIGRYNPPRSSDEIRVLGLND